MPRLWGALTMRRYRMETWDATKARCLSIVWASWPVLARANADDPDILAAVRRLTVGATTSFGGGAAPITRITRET